MRPHLFISVVLTLSLSGCEMLNWARPHQLWKLNRQPAGGRNDPYFSIPSQPIPESESSPGVEGSRS